MVFLIIAVAAMSLFMLTLKFMAVKNISASQAIIANYIFATAFGFILYRGRLSFGAVFDSDWWYLSVIAGVLLFSSLHIMAISTRVAGVAVTTISSRTSLVLPIIVAALFLNETISVWQLIGISLVIIALIIIFYRKNGSSTSMRQKIKAVLLPVSVFISIGAIAVCMKSAQHIIKETGNPGTDLQLYQTMSFLIALLCAIVYYAFTEGKKVFLFNRKSIIGGAILGASNLTATTSVLFALMTLSTSAFYTAYNIGIVAITIVAGRLAFGEKLTAQKVSGILLALAGIAILMFLG